MFSLHDFVITTLRGMVAAEPEYKVRQYALAWYDKAELTDADMEELDLALTPPVSVESVAEDVNELGEVVDAMLGGDGDGTV